MSGNPFSEKKKTYQDGLFLGAYMSPENYDYVKLFAMYEDTAVQNAVNIIIEQVKNNQDMIIQTLIDRAVNEFVNNRDHNLEKYLNEISGELDRRKIQQEEIINKILDGIRQKINETNKIKRTN